MIKTIRHTLMTSLAVLSSSFLLISPRVNAQQAASSPSSILTGDVGAAPGRDNQSGELEHVTVTGYIVPRVGDGPAPVTSLDNNLSLIHI